MGEKRPIALYNGRFEELRPGDTLPGVGGGGTVLSPSQITAWQNNYNPSSWGSGVSILRLSSNQFHFLSGLTATSDGHTVRIINVGAFPIGLYNQNTDSTAANRFGFDDHDVIILPSQSVTLFYDGTTSRWELAAPYALNEFSPFVAQYWNECYSIGNDDHGTLFNVSGNVHYADDSAAEVGNRSGIVALTTSTGISNRAFFYPSNSTGLRYDDGTGKNYMEYRAVFKTPAALSDATNRYALEIGFLDNVTSGVQTDGAMLYYRDDVNSGNWSRQTHNGGAQTSTNTGVAVVANTWYVARCVLYPNGTAEFYLDGVSLGRNTANIPGSSGVAFTFGAGIRKSAGSTERILKLDGCGYTIVKYRK